MILLLPALSDAGNRHRERPPTLTFNGPGHETDLGHGQKLVSYGAIFLLGSLAQATMPVYLHAEGITIEPGSEAEIYLVNPSDPTARPYRQADFIGSIATVQGSPSKLPYMTFEIHDFEADGKKYTARSTLREMAGFDLVLLVKHGSVRVERYVLTTDPKSERATSAKSK